MIFVVAKATVPAHIPWELLNEDVVLKHDKALGYGSSLLKLHPSSIIPVVYREKWCFNRFI